MKLILLINSITKFAKVSNHRYNSLIKYHGEFARIN